MIRKKGNINHEEKICKNTEQIIEEFKKVLPKGEEEISIHQLIKIYYESSKKIKNSNEIIVTEELIKQKLN